MRNFFTTIICFLALAILIVGCKEDRNMIPNTYVNFEISLDDRDIKLQPGYIKTFSGNTHGYSNTTVVYRSGLGDIPEDDFHAYDVTCPNCYYYNPYYSYGCQIIDSTGCYTPPDLCFRCNCCMTEYNILSGFPQKVIDKQNKYPLRKLKVTKGRWSGVFIVSNE
ncbi:MAG: hypothetical protein LBU91_06215 [Bacteroidales bacterium]|jgi:hypothetical protein|nr:hypothetical protein [Bacteroidales bacterium]